MRVPIPMKDAMSFWKCWITGQDNNNHADYRNEELDKDGQQGSTDKQRDKHQMSVSRSGRYKQRQRRRSGILDNPGLRKLLQDASGRSPETEAGPGKEEQTTAEKREPISDGSVRVEACEPEVELNWEYPAIIDCSDATNATSSNKGLLLGSKSLPDMRVAEVAL